MTDEEALARMKNEVAITVAAALNFIAQNNVDLAKDQLILAIKAINDYQAWVGS